MTEDEEKKNKSCNKDKEFNITFGKKTNQLELIISNADELEYYIDDILYLNDLVNKISNISGFRDEFISLFSVNKENIEFYFDISAWSQWEKSALILFTRFPFPTSRDYVSIHDIPKGNLNKYLSRYEEYFKKFSNNQISLTREGFIFILDKLRSEMIKERKSEKETEITEESE